MSQEFNSNVLALVKQKIFYPYEYMSDFQKFKEEVPSKEKFYSSLTVEEYEHVLKVWNILKQQSHKKRKDSLEARAVLLMFLLELEIFKVAVQGIHQNSHKWLFSVRNFLVKVTLRLF